jgi:hypothetical protein
LVISGHTSDRYTGDDVLPFSDLDPYVSTI